MYQAITEAEPRLPALRLASARGWCSRPLPLIRALDIIGASLLLLFVSPIMIGLALLIWSQDSGPPLYRQVRLGAGGRPFGVLKFRTMAVDAEARLQALLAGDPNLRLAWESDHKLRDDPRITPLGHFLRKSSLDELPQLFNVLAGEMSLVGPRPIVEAEVWLYGRHFSRYCAVRPGITGLWQVSGRSDVSYRRRVVLDVAFVRRRSLSLYFAILLATIPAVLLRKGSY